MSEGAPARASPPRRVRLEVTVLEDRLWAAGAARRFARELGIDAAGQARLALAVAELASNIARHAGRGQLELVELEAPRAGCMVSSRDDGTGIEAIADALADGFSEGRWLTPDVPLAGRGGLGVGLGSVQRAMDEMRVWRGPRGGLRVEAVLWCDAGTADRTRRTRWRRA